MLKKIRPDHFDKVKNLLPSFKLDDFRETYMTELKTWHAFGLFDNSKEDNLLGISCCYYSGEVPEWHYINHYCDDNGDLLKLVNETCKRFESHGLQRFAWASRSYDIDYLLNYIPDRYVSFFDYKVVEYYKAQYARHFQSLYSGQWCPVKSEVHFSVLRQNHRKK